MVVWPRTMSTFDPWREMQRLERELDAHFTGRARPAAQEWPVLNVHANEKGLRLQALVPGFAIEDLELTVSGSSLVLRGTRKQEAAHELRQFERRVTLPYAIDAERVKAVAKDGVLDVELPRVAADTPRRIPVRSE